MDIVNIYWVFLLLLCFGRTRSTDDEDSDCELKCENGGQCIYGSCDCEPPYKGPTCEDDPCHPNPCENNQNCTLTKESFSCDCNNSYSGKFCEQVMNLCTSKICHFGETCKTVYGVPTCFKEVSTSSIILSTTEKLSTTTQDESRTTEENSESSTTGKEGSTDIETQSSNELTLTKKSNGSTPIAESDEYSRITEEYLSNSSLVNSTVNLVDATDAFSYENATSTIYPSVTNTSFDEFNKLSTESDVSNVTDDISTKVVVIDMCEIIICRNGGSCVMTSGEAKCECPEFFTGRICEEATSKHLTTTTEEFNTTAENSESTNDSIYNTTTEPQSTETTSEDLISSNATSSVVIKATTENTSATSDNEEVTTKDPLVVTSSPSTDTTSDESISSIETSSVGTSADDSKTTSENKSSTSGNEEVTTKESPSPDTTSDDSISSNRPSSFGTTTDNSNINTENIHSTTDKEDNTTPDSLTAETTQSVSSTITEDTTTEVGIDKKKAFQRNVAYICGGIGGGLGIIFFIVGIIYYLKRLKKRKHLLYFKSGDTSSMGSSDSTTHLA